MRCNSLRPGGVNEQHHREEEASERDTLSHVVVGRVGPSAFDVPRDNFNAIPSYDTPKQCCNPTLATVNSKTNGSYDDNILSTRVYGTPENEASWGLFAQPLPISPN